MILQLGSHIDVARILAPAGDWGFSFMELAEKLNVTANHREALVTGEAGTVYLCHPFIVHAGQAHLGANPRFLARPPLYPSEPLRVSRADGKYSPVEVAIRRGTIHEHLISVGES